MFRVAGKNLPEVFGCLVEVFRVEINQAETQIRFGLIRSQLDRPLKLLARVGQTLERGESRGERAMNRGVVRPHFNVTRKLLACLLEFPLPEKSASQAVKGKRIVWPQFETSLECL